MDTTSGGVDEKTKEKEDNERSRTMRYYMKLYTVDTTIYNNNNNMINCTYSILNLYRHKSSF